MFHRHASCDGFHRCRKIKPPAGRLPIVFTRMLKNLPAAFSHRSETQHTEVYTSPLRSLRPYWTDF